MIDWIKLPYFPPTFNIADSAITIGAALLVLASLRGWRLNGHSPRPDQNIQQTAPGRRPATDPLPDDLRQALETKRPAA